MHGGKFTQGMKWNWKQIRICISKLCTFTGAAKPLWEMFGYATNIKRTGSQTLSLCGPGVWRCQLKTCWGCYFCSCWCWGSCWQQFVTDLGADGTIDLVDMNTTSLVFIQESESESESSPGRDGQEQNYLCKKDFWMSGSTIGWCLNQNVIFHTIPSYQCDSYQALSEISEAQPDIALKGCWLKSKNMKGQSFNLNKSKFIWLKLHASCFLMTAVKWPH